MPKIGTPASNSPSGALGAPSAYTEDGPPDKMIAFGCLASISLTGMRRWHDLRVDVALTNPAGDQLGILRPEVNHQNGVKPTRPRHTNRLPPGYIPCNGTV